MAKTKIGINVKTKIGRITKTKICRIITKTTTNLGTRNGGAGNVCHN